MLIVLYIQRPLRKEISRQAKHRNKTKIATTSEVKMENESMNWSQWFREGITSVISLVILALAAWMLFTTFNVAKQMPTGDAASISAYKEAYEREKDIMLYALALLGTVTGYYLGRVPAELHAQQAQKSASSAQHQLQETQKEFAGAASNAAQAGAEVTKAHSQREAAKARAMKATKMLRDAGDAIAQTLSAPIKKTLSADTERDESRDDDLRSLRNRIQDTLAEISDEAI